MNQDGPQTTVMVNGIDVLVSNPEGTLLELLRDQLSVGSVKDGCSPQGQCGCCTVLVDGKPRVACVTPVRRVRGKSIITLEGMDKERVDTWADAFAACGATQCGFCTPGIIVRLDGTPPAKLDSALAAHQCRCTGWQTIYEAYDRVQALGAAHNPAGSATPDRDWEAAQRRAELEARTTQQVGPHVALGLAPFAADSAPTDALVAVPSSEGGWSVAATLHDALRLSGKVQGRRTTEGCRWPLAVPDGSWSATLRTTWVDGAYLEPDAAWCQPGGEPTRAGGNGGAFGAKVGSWVPSAAQQLANEHDAPVLAVARREDVARQSPKRPPVAGGANGDGSGHLLVADHANFDATVAAIAAVAPGLTVEPAPLTGPPLSGAVRAAGWAEAAMLIAGAQGEASPVCSPDGATAAASFDRFDEDATIAVTVRCGQVLDPVVLRSYCIGAAQMAWSWLLEEFLAVDESGEVRDLTMRSFMVLRASEAPTVLVDIDNTDDREPVNGSDAVFAAVAAAGWVKLGCVADLPITQSSPQIRGEVAARTKAARAQTARTSTRKV